MQLEGPYVDGRPRRTLARAVRGAPVSREPAGAVREEIDPHTERHLGNFPQAFTHLALINAVVHVIRAEQHRRLGFAMPNRNAT